MIRKCRLCHVIGIFSFKDKETHVATCYEPGCLEIATRVSAIGPVCRVHKDLHRDGRMRPQKMT